MSSGNVFLGVLTGAAIGAAIGILYAPDRGSATRMKISQKSQDYANELSAKFNEIVKDLTEKVESASEEAKQLADNGKYKTNEAAARITDGPR